MDRESVDRIAQESRTQTFPAIIAEMTSAIELCIQRRMFLAGQMLMYAGIDIMANFDRPEEKAEGTQEDFKRWAMRYMLDPNPHLQVNADDLYGAMRPAPWSHRGIQEEPPGQSPDHLPGDQALADRASGKIARIESPG